MNPKITERWTSESSYLLCKGWTMKIKKCLMQFLKLKKKLTDMKLEYVYLTKKEGIMEE